MADIEYVKKNLKRGWKLNPNRNVVNSIIKGINRCDGECPCANDSEDKRCPCSNYREHDHCCCSLYVPNCVWLEMLNRKGKKVCVNDDKHVLMNDMFGQTVVVSFLKNEPNRIATQEDFDNCFTEK